MTIKEMATFYYPKFWDKSRLEALVKAGRLSQEEFLEITKVENGDAVSK